MASTPEEFMGQGLLTRPEPASPSVFLDLPPTPRGEDPASFDDMVLPYISRVLMAEDNDDHFFYPYPDHPALLRAQLPFAQILSEGSGKSTLSSSSSSSDAHAPPSPSTGVAGVAAGSPAGESWRLREGGGSTDIQNSAFLNGDEVAETVAFPGGNAEQGTLTSGLFRWLSPGDQDMLKLVVSPTNSSLLVDFSGEFMPRDGKPARSLAVREEVVGGILAGGGRKKHRYDWDKLEVEAGRASKLMTPAPEEDGAREAFDEMMLQEHEICMKGVQSNEPEKNSRNGSGKKARRRRGASDSDEMVDLQTLLLHCAQAVSTDDRRSASELLTKIKQNAVPRGDPAQRLAHYFSEGLEARLAGTGSDLYQSLMVKPTLVVDFLKAYQLFMAACCCKKVAFAFSNKTIYDAVAGRKRLHIVDYGLNYGFQWPGLLRALAAREGGPPEVRITGIDLPQPGFHAAYGIEATGLRLSNCARVFGVPFQFRGIAAKREAIRPEDLNIDRDEVLVVISLCHFRHLMDESLVSDGPSPRDQVLINIRKMRPDVFIHGVLNGSYGATYFLTRFREALFHYSAQFDLLDATVPRDSNERLLIERDIFGRSILNVVACEGAHRVERPETYKQWELRNLRAGLRQLPLNPEVVKLVLDKVKDNYHKDFVVDEDRQWLVHRWKGRVLYTWSTWVADDGTSHF